MSTSGRSKAPEARLTRLLGHLPQDALARVGPEMLAPADKVARARSFRNGVIAHMLIVPGWVGSPLAILVGLIAAVAPIGRRGVLAALGIGGVLAGGLPNGKVGALMCAILAVLAAASKKATAVAGMGVVAFFTWLVTSSRLTNIGSQRFFDYVSTWCGDYYEKAELRGALDTIRHGKTFFAFHPHGCLCAGFTINGTYNAEFLRLAGKVAFLCDPALREKNPGFRLMAELYKGENRSIASCDAAGFKDHMERGESVAFIPGGFLDASTMVFDKDSVVLKNRKAFIKYNLKYGYRVHPIYTFGECETYHTMTAFRKFRLKLAAKQIPALAFFGWPMCPILPRPQTKLLTYVGEGIDFPFLPDATRDDVDQWHARYVEELRRLYNTHKAEAGRPNDELEIL